QLEVQAQASLADVAKVQIGMPARVEIEGLADRTFNGRVERINPSAEPGTRSIYVYVSLKNEGSLLKAGMFARVRLTMAAERETAALPVSAIRGEGAQTYVWLLAEAMPEVRPPFVAVRVDYPGASPEQVENDVAKPIENAVNQVAGVKRLLSASYEGFGWTWIEFRLNVDQDRVLQEVRDRVAQ